MNNIISIKTWGGIGDAWLTTPSLQSLKKKYPDSELRVLCMDNHIEVLENNPYIDFLSTCPEESEFKNANFLETNYGRLQPSINCNKHATEIIADMLDVKLNDKKLTISLSVEEEHKAKNVLSSYIKTITIHTSPGSSKNKEWPIEKWEKLIKKMAGYTFIQLGLKNDQKIKGALDMSGNTTVREAIALVKYSQCFVGVDSFPAHATSAVGTPGVILFGSSNPTIWGYEDNTNIYKGLKCAPCVDIIDRNNCPYNKKCMTDITVEEVNAAILKNIA